MDIISTVFLSQIIGCVFLALSVSMFLTPGMMRSIFKDLGKNRSLSYVIGIIMLVVALLVTLNHTDFVTEPGKIIMLLGYAVLIEAAFFLLSPAQLIKRYTKTLKNDRFYYGIALGYLTIGLYLVYVGFFVSI